MISRVGIYAFYMAWVTCAHVDGSFVMPISDVLTEEAGPFAAEVPCPWPFDPILPHMLNAPLGQYHCPYCGSMIMAGIPHIDYTGFREINWDVVVHSPDGYKEPPRWP